MCIYIYIYIYITVIGNPPSPTITSSAVRIFSWSRFDYPTLYTTPHPIYLLIYPLAHSLNHPLNYLLIQKINLM
jgi:hypothetical protein